MRAGSPGAVRPTVVDDWFWIPDRRPSAALRLFCFPHAGATAATFTRLAADLPDRVEVWALRPPGRGGRHQDRYPPDFDSLIAVVADRMWSRAEEPYAVYGQSYGGLLAYEVARTFPASRGPIAIAVASVHAPHRWTSTNSTTQTVDARTLLELSASTPATVLEDRELAAASVAAVSADLRICRTYRHRPGPPPAMRLRALVGAHDPLVSTGQMAEWERYTSGPFELTVIPGGHVLARPDAPAIAGPVEAMVREHL